jgi:hypothetical protein
LYSLTIRENIVTSNNASKKEIKMYAHYTTYTKQGKKVHLMSITPTPSMREGSKESKFDTAKEAKAYAKAIGAKAWNY